MGAGGRAGKALVSLLAAIAAALASGAAIAAPSTKIGTANLISPTAADSYYGGASTSTNSIGWTARPKEVQELARALKRDPDLIYEHIRNNMTTVWSYGLTKGAEGVIIDRAGTAFDQAHLMVELLRESGFTASYKLGTITLSGTQFQTWSGITSAMTACQMLSSGGIPAVINGSTTADCSYGAATITSIELAHAWVAVTLSGVTYLYDPAFKDHTFKAGINLGTATGMSSGAVMGTSATTGTVSGVASLASFSTSTLSTNLTAYSTNLETAIDAMSPAAGMADVVGGKSINPQALPQGGLRQLSLPYTTNVLRTISGEMPDQYRTKLRVQITKVRPDSSTPTAIDKTLYVDEIYGRRLTFDTNFDTSGASFTGALKLTDEFGAAVSLASATYSDNPTYSRGTVTLTVDMPYAAVSGGYMDAVIAKPVNYALPLTVVHGWGETGRGLIDKWGQRQDTAMPAVPDTTCKACFPMYRAWKGDGRREALAAAWLAQASRAAQLNAAIAKGVLVQHYSVGVSAADTTVLQTANGAFWVTDSFDRLDVDSGVSLTSATATAADRRGALYAAVAAMDALKGSVPAQVADLPDSSSVATRFEWGNAPPASEDGPIGGAVRSFYRYTNSTDASYALSLSHAEGQTTTAASGVHGANDPVIGNTEMVARRQALADAVSAMVSDGFVVTASEEAFLGPGTRGGGFAPSGTDYTHAQTPQRGGAIAATKLDGSGDPTEIAHVLVGPQGPVGGGGGGAQIYHQMQYDPATSADVVRGLFVTPPVGQVTIASPAKVVVGSGKFPFQMTGELIWRGSVAREETYGPGAHREPQGGWTTNWNNALTISGSGLEAMGQSDARAAAMSIAAFYAAQDAYKSTASIKRDVAGEMVAAWWVRRLNQNVATVSLGTSTQQFVRRASGTWLAPGAGVRGSLTQTNAPAVSPRHPTISGSCTSAMLTYVPTRGWSYSGVSFKVTSPTGDEQVFQAWSNQMLDTSGCAEQRGFRLATWTWPKGVQLTFVYGRGPTDFTHTEALLTVSNGLNQKITLLDNGTTGLTGSSVGDWGAGSRTVTVGQNGAQVTHTDAIGAVTKFDFLNLGTGLFAAQRLEKIYAADEATLPATQYVYDSLGRLQQTKDRLVLAGSRAPSQLFLADGLRGETLSALGYSAVAYVDPNGDVVRSIDPAGGVTTGTFDGRGRTLTLTTADGAQIQFEYNNRNLLTKTTRLAKVGSAEAGQTLVTETGWNATWAMPAWTKDAKGAQTDYTTSYDEITAISYPPANPGEGRLGAYQYLYPNGLAMGITRPMGRSISATYEDVSIESLSDSAGSAGVFSDVVHDAMGDAVDMKSPRNAHTLISRDLLRRPTLTVGPQVGTQARVAQRTTYDLVGRVTKVERGSYSGTTFTPLEAYTAEYDAVGNRVKSTGPANVTQFSYDALNRLVCSATRMNPAVYASLPADACTPSQPGVYGPDRISRVTYDALSRVVQTESGVGSDLQQVTARYGYTPGGLRISLTDANNNTSTFEYDGFERLKRLRYPAQPRGAGVSSTTDYEEYGYDANGNRTSVRKRSGQTITYVYDAINRLASKDFPGTTTDDVYFKYLDAGRKLEGRLGSPTNTTVFTIDYDQAGRPKTDTNPTDPTTAVYDAEGNLTQIGRQYNVYDVANRLTAIGWTYTTYTPSELAWLYYAPLNRLGSISRKNGVTTSYNYDASGRLTMLSHGGAPGQPSSTQSFTYNPAGQLVGQGQAGDAFVWTGHPTTTTNATHDALNRDAAIVAASGYDADGNLISDGARTFTYDAENKLRSVTGGTAPVTLAYDPFGRLASVTSNGVSTIFGYLGDKLIWEYGTGLNAYPRKRYIYGPAGEPMIWQDLAGEGSVLREQWLHQDRLGSVIAVSDIAGVITPYTYGPYGEPQSWSGSRFRYTGQMAIPEAQLYHYKARAYDPVPGRFLQTDPTGFDGGLNLYGYVAGDPINLIDPNGTEPSGPIDIYTPTAPNGDTATSSGDGGVVVTACCRTQTLVNPISPTCSYFTCGGAPSPFTVMDAFFNPYGRPFDPLTLPITPGIPPLQSAQNTLAARWLANWNFSGGIFPRQLEAAGVKLVIGNDERIDHTVERHGLGRADPNAGEFNTANEATIGRYISDGLLDTGQVVRPNTAGRAGLIVDSNVGYIIGTSGGGRSTSTIRIILMPSGVAGVYIVWTAFPI